MIPLTQNQFAKVDDGDYELVVKYRWRAVKQLRKLGPIRWYAMATIDGKSVMMHRLILGVTDDLQVDHEDNNGLNNIRLNMRVCTKAQNQHNQRVKTFAKTSQYKGVSWRQRDDCWQSHIMVDNKSLNLGQYDSEIDAAYAYDIAAREYFGSYARTNFLTPPDYVPVRHRTSKTSQYRGVYWEERRQKWQSSITINGKRRFLGRWSPRMVDGIDEGELDAYKALQVAQMEAAQLRMSNANS